MLYIGMEADMKLNDNFEMLLGRLGRLGYAIRRAANQEEAVDLIEKSQCLLLSPEMIKDKPTDRLILKIVEFRPRPTIVWYHKAS
jgi:hypothetical protein